MYKVIYMYVSLSVAPYVIAVYYYFFIFLDCNQKSINGNALLQYQH
jgi:hypothetical protein